MREGVGRSVSAVVHHQCPTLHLLLDEPCHVWIAVARRRGSARIGIPVDLLQLVALMVRLHQGGHLVGCLHVCIVVAVVAHEAEHVLPGSRMLVLCIADGLVSQDGGTLQGPDGEAPHSHIGLTQIGRTHATDFLDPFLVVEQTEEIVADEAAHRTERVVALEAEQEIVRIIAAPLRTVHAVVPGTVAIEQQVSGHIRLRRSPVVEHLHIAAIGRSVRGPARELIIQLIGRHDPHAQTVALLVQRLDAFSLCQPLLRGGDDDHHVHSPIGMMVLVRDVVHIFRFRQRSRLEVGLVLGRIVHEGDIVQSEVCPRGLGDTHRVLSLHDAVELIFVHILLCLRIAVEVHALPDGAHQRVVHLHLRLIVAVSRQGYSQRPGFSLGSQCIGPWCADGEELLVEEVAPTVIPRIVVHLVQAVIILRQRIGCGRQYLLTDDERLLFASRQEVIAIIRIRITRAREGLLRFPCHRPNGIEDSLTVNHTGSHLLQIVRRLQIVARQTFRLQSTAIAVDPHPVDIREASLLHQRLRQLVVAALRHTDLHPRPFFQNGVRRITHAVAFATSRSPNAFGTSLHLQHKAHELLIPPVAIDQRHELHVEHTLLTHHAHRLLHHRHRRQGLTAELLITLDISFAHIDKLRIVDPHGIDRVSIARSQLLLVGEDGQRLTNPDLLRCQIIERLGRDTKTSCEEHQPHPHKDSSPLCPFTIVHQYDNVARGVLL